MKTVTTTSSINVCWVLFFIFLTLKLTGHIDWSWWYVTMPLWIGLVVAVGVLLVFGILYGIHKITTTPRYPSGLTDLPPGKRK